MNIICKKGNEYTHEEYEELFQIFKENMKEMADKNALTEKMVSNDYQEKWINQFIGNPNIKLFIFKENEKIISYVIVEEREKENYVSEFQITKEYQKDGHTFKNMFVEGLKFIELEKRKTGITYLDFTKDFTGDIWMNNEHSREVFKHLGVKFDGKEFRMSGKMLMEWITK